MNLIFQVVSIAGAAQILVAFFGLQRGWWTSHSAVYLWINLIGALFLLAVAIWDRRIGFVILEAVWALVSLWSIFFPAAPGVSK